jgi:hypothetical protein
LISPQLNVHELLLPWDAEQGTVYSIVQQWKCNYFIMQCSPKRAQLLYISATVPHARNGTS